MLKLLAYLTGGRPMKLIQHCRFVDRVSGESVNLYMDRLDRFWLATSAWSWFRIKWPDGDPE